MDADTILVIGLFLGVFAIPSLVSALSEQRAPRLGTILLLTAGVLVAVAASRKPSGYTLGQIPDVVLRVMNQLLN